MSQKHHLSKLGTNPVLDDFILKIYQILISDSSLFECWSNEKENTLHVFQNKCQ